MASHCTCHAWLAASKNCPRFIEKNKRPQTSQLWTHWTITFGAPCWKSTVRSSRSVRRLVSWKWLCRAWHCVKIYRENTSTRRWRTSQQVIDSLLVLQWLCPAPRLQIYTFSSQHQKRLFSDPPTYYRKKTTLETLTRSSATAKSTARPSCLVGVLYDIYRETNNRSTANQPLVRNWPWNLSNSAK